MSPPSALLGSPPANENDYLIVRAYFVTIGMADKMDPSKGFNPPIPRPPPDQYHFESKQPLIYGYNSLLMVLMVAATAARIMIRVLNYKLKTGWDDWVIIIATFCALAGLATTMASVTYGGVGKHIYDLTYEEYAFFLSTFGARVLNFYVALAVVKLSIILFYMRLNNFTSRKWMVTHWTLFTIVASLLICSIFLVIFPCQPIAPHWNFRLVGYMDSPPKCLAQFTPILALNILHIVTDASLLIVPVAMLWHVHMKWSTKFRVWIIGIVGCVNIMLSIIRTVYNSPNVVPHDITWQYTELNAWAIAELTLGVITASLPVLSSVVNKAFKKHFNNHHVHPNANGNYVFEKARKMGGNIGRRWPGGRPQHRDVDDSVSLGGTTTVSEGLDEQGRPVTNRFREEYGIDDGDDDASIFGLERPSKTHSQSTDIEMGIDPHDKADHDKADHDKDEIVVFGQAV